ncbi:MAG TPA: NAD-dependent epimerase/dehydratase family protein [Candidatus Wunengus sp. YC60]|uniref:NAD-dependent epimerase/dehydratase family protein n=1 Tax=Candidatus Wunengus sp. YC60 TaxID=3367697 RepID=UPI00402785E6
MILVTGATGFVGYHLVNDLVSQHKKVRCLVRSDTSKINVLDKEIEIVKGDIRDKNVVNKAVKGVKQVVHLAAVIQNPDPEVVCQVNIEGTKNLVQSSVQNGIEQFVFFSSLNVILPVRNQYSKSKLAAEGVVQESGLNFTILRPSIIYGKSDDGTIAKLISSVKTKKMIFLLGNGEYKLQPIYVDDAVKAICDVLKDVYGFKNKILFLVGKDIVSYNELADLISDIIGIKGHKLHVPLSVISVIVKTLSLFSKKGIQLEDKLKTYSFDKIVNEPLQKDIFPVQVTSLKDALSAYV